MHLTLVEYIDKYPSQYRDGYWYARYLLKDTETNAEFSIELKFDHSPTIDEVTAAASQYVAIENNKGV